MAVEEAFHGVREVAKRLLPYRLRALSKPRISGTDRCEFPTLLEVTRRGLPRAVPVGMLLDREVPHESRGRAVQEHRCFLLLSRLKKIPGHANTLSKDMITGRSLISFQPNRTKPGFLCPSDGEGFRWRFR